MLTIVGESKLAAQTLIELGADVNARNVNYLLLNDSRNTKLEVLTRCLLL
jgi:hypothetical protein